MNPISRYISILLVCCVLLACGADFTSEDHLNNATAFLEQSDDASAIIELKNALKKDVNNARARALLGKLHFEAGAYEDAEKELSRALSAGVDIADVAPILSQVLLGLGDYKRLDSLSMDGLDPENRSTVQAAKGLSMVFRDDLVAAAEIMETALQNEPNSPYAQVAAARLAMEKESYDEARSRLKEVFAKNPKYAPAWNLLGDIESAQKQPQQAELAYTKVIEISNSSFEARANRAMMRIYQRNFDGAFQDLSTLGQTHGAVANLHPGVQFAWGLYYLQNKQIDPAGRAFEQAAQFSESYPQSLYYLAAINLEQGFVEQATSNVYRFLGLVPGSVVGTKLAAKLELGQKNYSKAEKLLLPLVAVRPDDIEAMNLLASALLAQGKSGEGVEFLAKVVELQPDSAEAKARLGAGFLAAGSEELGIETLRAILEKDPSYEQADILLVLNYLRHNKLAEGVRAAQEYQARNPESATSYDLLGRAYLANKESEPARAAFSRALELRPGDPGAGNSLADFALAEKDYESARRYYQQVLQHNPDHMKTRMKIAASYAVEGKEQEMLDSLQSTLAAYPRAMEPRLVKARYYIAKGQLEKVSPLFEELTQEQKQHPDALITLAGFELAGGRYNQALGTLGKLIDDYPNVSQYHYMKSKAYAGLGDIEKFSAELQRTVELDPQHFYAKIAQARLALISNRMDLFDEKLAELREMAPDNPDVMKLEVASAQKRGDNKAAVQLLETLYEREPTAGNVIALAAYRQSGGNTKGAIEQLQHWLDDHPSDITVREKLAEVYGSNNQIGGVVYQYREILKVDPNHVIALNNLAWYLLNDDPKQALAYAEKAIELSPESSAILDTLALVQMKNNRMLEARRSIDRAIGLNPNSPEMRFHEAQIRAAEGDTEGAIIAVNALLEKHAQFSERPEAVALLKQLTEH